MFTVANVRTMISVARTFYDLHNTLAPELLSLKLSLLGIAILSGVRVIPMESPWVIVSVQEVKVGAALLVAQRGESQIIPHIF
jgi:hypothetical protein